ncbi:MAG: hypothetical protein AMXMBFR47_15750 [Planctomycetota bacterium]
MTRILANTGLATTALAVVLSAGFSGGAFGQSQRTYAVTDATGTYLVTETQPGDGTGWGGSPRDLIWEYNTGFSIPQTVALSAAGSSAWVGEDLNSEALDRFDVPGTGFPDDSYSLLGADFTAVAASMYADRAAILYKMGGQLHLNVHRSDLNTTEWTYTFPPEFTSADYAGVKVSRDGSKVAALVLNPTSPGNSVLYTFDGPTGTPGPTWTYAGYAGPIDLNDTGSLCLVTQGSSGRLIDTATATEIFTAPGSGAGSRHKISGNGNVLVIGGFSLHVYVHNGSTYTLQINFTAPTSWFGWGAAVSRDGSTVGVMSHDYASGYLNTATRIWDVPTGALLNTYPTTGSGSFQDSISGAVLSDDGSTLVVSSWGAQDNNHPEVMIFDRDLELIGSIDTPGSVFGLDMTGDGLYVLSGSKAVHANTFGNGGRVHLFGLGGGCLPGDLDCDCQIGISDLSMFLSAYGSCTGDGTYNADADLDASGCIDITDLALILAVFGTGC